MIDHNSARLLGFIQSVGVAVTVSQDRIGTYHLAATDQDGQRYALTGSDLYALAVHLAEQVGIDLQDG